MKVFISWSGELSQKIAKELSDWLPSIIQSIEVFYSPDDIKKGENWDNRLTNELHDSKYGIVCLTPENVLAPWIHFEAGALSKTLDSSVSALMINIVTSDIQGPLSRFQATKLEKADFYKLLESINEVSDTPIKEEVLQKSFDAIWDKMYENIIKIIDQSNNEGENTAKESNDVNTVLEELLQLVRKQDSILSNPEKLLPIGYWEKINRNISTYKNNQDDIINILDKISAELIYLHESDTSEAEKEFIVDFYDILIDIATQYRCDREFIRFLQDNQKDIKQFRKKQKLYFESSDLPDHYI